MKKNLLTLLSLFIFCFAARAQINLTLGLVVWYKLDGNTVDSSGNGINATPNSATLTTDRFGNANSAYSLSGFSSYLMTPSTVLMNTGNEMSAAAWVNLASATANQKIMGRTDGPPFSTGFVMGVQNGHIYPEVWNSSGTLYAMTTAGTFSSNTWTHLCMTYSGGQYLVAYVNGAAVDSVSVAGFPIGSNSDNLIIGIAPWDLSSFGTDESIDDVRLYNRKINAGEVLALFNLTTGIPDVNGDPETFVYPNPSVNGMFSVESNLRISNIRVTDVLGNVIRERIENPGNKFSLDLSALSKGIYFVDMLAGEQVARKKIIID